ncbi:MAG: class I SAM-dependent methyltransferase [Chloroflexi bacterium]|nr:class I SAM-dependent methyltransferase [Chloroflexota bacterium]
MDETLKANRDHWNDLAVINAGSELYQLEQFKAGRNKLHPLETGEVGDVTGKSLLHLQCHFGMDTLSWARRGAGVTGVDFSDQAVAQAQALSAELGIPARFLCSNVYDLPDALDEQFDIVFTSYGVLCWLPDVPRWAQVAARYVKPGGMFYIAEFQPLVWVCEDDPETGGYRMKYSYFHQAEPWTSDEQGSYADRNAVVAHPRQYEWQHPVSEVVTALIDAGLRVEFLHEHPFTVFNQLSCMEQDDQGRWWLPGRATPFPLMYSIKATKELAP